MENTVVKVVGPVSSGFAEESKIGDKLVIRLNTYPKDPTAIKLETVNGEEVGYVAAKTATAGGYPLAKEVYTDLTEGDMVEISSINPFLVNIIKKEKSANTKVTTKLIALLAGNKMEYPSRIKIVNALRQAKGSEICLDVEVVGDRIVLSFEGIPCGYASSGVVSAADRVLKANKMVVTPIETIMSAINTSEKTVAKSTWIDGMVVPIIFEVETEAEAVKIAVGDKDISSLLKAFDDSDATEIQKRVDWLKSIKTQEYSISLFLDRIKSHKGISPFTPCYIPQHEEVENAIAFSHGIGAHRGNILLTGPAGSGKNMFIITFANLMDLQLIDKSCSAGVDEEAVFGYLSMKASEEKPDTQAVNLAFKRMLTSMGFSKIENKKVFAELATDIQIDVLKGITEDDNFDYSVLFDAMRAQAAEIKFEPSVITKSLEYPSLINLDEVNTLRPLVTSSLHSALDKRRSVLVNGYKTVDISEDVIFTATMNEGSEYAGTSTMNLAFEDRWHVIEFEAPDTIATILKQEVPTLSSKAIKILDDLYIRMKALRGVDIQERSFSQRAFIYCGINIALGNDIKKAIMATIVPKIRDVEDRESVKALIDLKLK